MNHWHALKADTHRLCGHYAFKSLVIKAISNRTFRVVVTMRLCNLLSSSNWLGKMLLPVLQSLHRLSTTIACMDFPWRTEIDGGLALTHGRGMVVHQGVKIGKNVTLFHGVTLGRRDKILTNGERLTEYPVIEDDVWVGPNAIIVGGVIIGRGSRIAGGSFVTDNVAPFSTILGNPATIVNRNCIPDVMNPAP
jgi:serine O-acetyltransferase